MAMTEQQRTWIAGLLGGAGARPAALASTQAQDSGGGPGAEQDGTGGARGAPPVGHSEDSGGGPPAATEPAADDGGERALTSGERGYAHDVFKDSLDYDAITVTKDALASTGASRTVGNTINLEAELFEPGTLDLTQQGMQTLVHEMAHVWQYQHNGWSYAPGALWAQFKAWVTTGSRNAAYDWRTPAAAGTPWADWNPEAQAEAVERYNVALRAARSGKGTTADYADLATLQPYIDGMVAGPPPIPDDDGGGGAEGADGAGGGDGQGGAGGGAGGDAGSAGGVDGNAGAGGHEGSAGTLNAIGKAAEQAARAAREAAETAREAAEKAAGVAADAARVTAEKVAELAGKAAGAAGGLAEGAGEAVSDAVDAARDAAGQVADAAGTVAGVAGDLAGRTAEKAAELASSAAGAATDAANSVMDSLFGDEEK